MTREKQTECTCGTMYEHGSECPAGAGPLREALHELVEKAEAMLEARNRTIATARECDALTKAAAKAREALGEKDEVS